MNYELLNVQSCETSAPSEISDINEFSMDDTFKIYVSSE